MFEKIYIHIGLPKTGSTAIQNCMEALSRAGELSVVSYPVFGAERCEQSIQSGNGAAIAELLAPDITPVFCTARLQKVFTELLDVSDLSKKILIVSSEIFFSAAVERFLYFKNLLMMNSKSIELLMCARPLNEICYSSYHQVVKRHGYTRGYGSEWFSEFVDDLLSSKLTSVQQWGVPGKVIEYRKGALLNDFLKLIGEDASLATRFEDRRVNRSLTQKELDLLLQIDTVFKNELLSMRISDRWIHARPQVNKLESVHDAEALYTIFAQKLSLIDRSFTSESIRKTLAIIQSGGSNQSVGCLASAATSNSLDDDDLQSDNLLLMALSEVKDFLNLDSALGAYTGLMTPTKEAFDPIHYLLLNRDVLAAGVDPVLHYKEFGKIEGRSAAFNVTDVIFGKL